MSVLCLRAKENLGFTIISRRKQNALFDGTTAIKFAKAGLEEHDLLAYEAFAEVCINGTYSEGMLIQSLDVRDGLYHLVPVSHDGGISATVMVHGTGGHLLGVRKHREPVDSIMISIDEARKRVLRRKQIYFNDNRTPIVVRRKELSDTSKLVWRPCQESLSPYHPFHLFTMDKDRVYVSYDGRVYPELTPLGRRQLPIVRR